ncbi:MAG: AAA family ATPase [Acidobacteria bacterium]|nr:AAA family ATPase [Acidobacteriota bacterium]
MKLSKVHITKFQSIEDSTEFDVGDVTCLVGKNEAGKTALLKALYRLNPVSESEGAFDVTEDYPRREVSDYEDAVNAGEEPASVVHATYALEPGDIAAVREVYGPDCLRDDNPGLVLHKGYSNEGSLSELNVDDKKAVHYLVENAGLPDPIVTAVRACTSFVEMVDVLAGGEQTEAVQTLTPQLQEISEHGVAHVIYASILHERTPKFLYFDEYYQMKGHDNLDALRNRLASDSLEPADRPLLGLISLAGLDLDKLIDPRRTQALIAKLEAAENRLTQKVLKYWSQNRHLRMRFDIRPAQPEDGPGMTEGLNIWGRVQDNRHMVSTGLGTRSRGFVWFFSFLAWYFKLKQEGANLILLLDEPGLSLHAKAQADLLRYFEEDLKTRHQLIYTTHSPFMVDPRHLNRVRIVQDLSIEGEHDDLPNEEQGTRVTTEILEATPDSLFPLQGALGYEIHQTLFVGPNCLVVEGPSDLLYIQTLSTLLQERGRPGLRGEWTITPVGGSDKVPTFVALIGAQTDLNIAVLIDYQKKDRQNIENLYKRRLLAKRNVLTYASYVDGEEADVEDMFQPGFYLALVNGEFGSSIEENDLRHGHPRIVRRIEEHVKNHPLPDDASFNHYRPARYFAENAGKVKRELSDAELGRFQQLFDALNALLPLGTEARLIDDAEN